MHRRVGLHDLVVAENSVSLDDVEVLSSRARMQVAVVRVLAEFREDDLKKGRGTEKAKWSLSKAILKKLDDSTKTDDAETVTKHIARARAAIARKYEEATGLSLDENEINITDVLQQFGQRRFGPVTQFHDVRPAHR